MSGGNPNLAALVTQAPPEDTLSASSTAPCVGEAAQAPGAEPSTKAGCPCRCLFRRSPEPKLASVVPVATEEKDKEAVATVSQAVAELERVVNTSQEALPQEISQLGPQTGHNIGRKTLVLDLDETLVHSSFRVVPTADIVITIELEGEHHRIYVRKRPGVDEFLQRVAQLYEVVVYTASMAKYANPLLDQLDRDGVVSSRLFREACTRQPTGYVKDLSKLGRNLKDVIIIDNSPSCYALQPNNAIPIKTWRDDPNDRELFDLVPILYSLAGVEDIPLILKQLVWTADE